MKIFRVAVLASGSRGNATLVCVGGHKFLFDLGVSCRELTSKLRDEGTEPGELEAIFFTHEHIDHVRGLQTFRKKFPLVPLWASEGTWRGIFGAGWRRECALKIMPDKMNLGEVTLRRFNTSHDALEPVGYTAEYRGRKLAYFTDTGFVTEGAALAARGSEVLVLETNHDLEMLRSGSYPQELKKRIMGNRGHLCNLAAGWLLRELPELPKDIFLAHLSQENNRPELARETVMKLLADRNLAGVHIWVTDQKTVTTNYKKEDKYEEADIFA